MDGWAMFRTLSFRAMTNDSDKTTKAGAAGSVAHANFLAVKGCGIVSYQMEAHPKIFDNLARSVRGFQIHIEMPPK